MAQALLDGLIGWFADEDNTGPDYPGLPERRYVAAGDPRAIAWDDTAGQVTVALSRIMLGLNSISPPQPVRAPRTSPANHGRYQRTATFEVQVVRCVPTLCDADTLHAHGLLVLRDAGLLIRAVLDVANSGALTRRPVAEVGVTVDDLITLGPSGGAAAPAVGLAIPLL